MWRNEEHPLYGKETICHKCSGIAVWVFNGDMVGNYHYCRACKVETGPFAKKATPPSSPKDDELFDIKIEWPPGVIFYTKPITPLQIDTQMQMEDRMDQLLFDFMKPRQ